MAEANRSTAERTKFKAGAELRERILEAASQLFDEAGYQNVSMRKIAEDAGCSQMAAYRHFSDKDALIKQLRIDAYNQFSKVHERLDNVFDPRERLRLSLRDFVKLAVLHPHQYRIAFLVPPSDTQDQKQRIKMTKPIAASYLHCLQQVLPRGTSEAAAEEKLHQIMACLHGITVMLITHPHSYGLTTERAIRELESAFDRIVDAK